MSITYVDSVSHFELLFESFKKNSVVNSNSEVPVYLIGLDCEYITSSNFPNSFSNCSNWVNNTNYGVAVCTLQLSNKSTCLVINLTKFGKNIPQSLKTIIQSGNWIKVGVGIDLDITYLSDNFDLHQCNGCIDAKTCAILSNVKNPNLCTLSGEAKTFVNSKCDWSQPLTTDHIQYAGNDAILSYKLGEKIITLLKNSFADRKIVSTHYEQKTITFESASDVNYVGLLQEYVIGKTKNQIDMPKYGESRDNINNLFNYTCSVFGVTGCGSGKNKKQAKQLCAKDTYTKLMKTTKNN